MTIANDSLTGSTFETDLLAAVMQHSMLKHPFYVAWSEGKLTKSVLQQYAKQYYAHVRAFPTYVSAVHSHCDNFETRQLLLENLVEEEQGADNHPELWLRFAESFGGSFKTTDAECRLSRRSGRALRLRESDPGSGANETRRLERVLWNR
jgi:pyrroloquinoline-quinone synthase